MVGLRQRREDPSGPSGIPLPKILLQVDSSGAITTTGVSGTGPGMWTVFLCFVDLCIHSARQLANTLYDAKRDSWELRTPDVAFRDSVNNHEDKCDDNCCQFRFHRFV